MNKSSGIAFRLGLKHHPTGNREQLPAHGHRPELSVFRSTLVPTLERYTGPTKNSLATGRHSTAGGGSGTRFGQHLEQKLLPRLSMTLPGTDAPVRHANRAAEIAVEKLNEGRYQLGSPP